MLRVLVTDDIDRDGVALLEAEPRLRVDEVPTLPAPALLERAGDYDAIVGRSATKISADLLRAARRLKVVGRAGVGVDNVAMDVATELGVAVINAPAGNTVAVAELFFGAVLGLLRELPRAHQAMREGRWDRGTFLGAELQGRTLGIVGLGRIGGVAARRWSRTTRTWVTRGSSSSACAAPRRSRNSSTPATCSPCTRRSPTRRAA
jgi:D-3-phosphoglycerate dehydrogenase